MLNALGVTAVLVGMVLAVAAPTLLFWLCLAIAVAMVIREEVEKKRRR